MNGEVLYGAFIVVVAFGVMIALTYLWDWWLNR